MTKNSANTLAANCMLLKPIKKRHILFIIENNTFPTDIRVWKEATTAQKIGYDVTVISPKSNKYFENFETIENIDIYRHPSFSRKEGIFSQILEYANAFFWEIFLTFKIMLKKRFDIIHAANPPDHIFILAFIFKPFGVKYIFDHHDIAPDIYISKFGIRNKTVFKILKLMEKLSCSLADVIISTNFSYKKYIMQLHNARAEKIFVVRNDPDISKNIKLSNKSRRENRLSTKLLYAGSINSQDGVDLLVHIIYILVNQFNHKNFHCTIVGDGDALSDIKKACVNLGVENYFTFTGFIHDREMVYNFINDSDICVETAPKNDANSKSTFIKIMEYMAASKPIIAFNLEETRFSASESAILVEPGDLPSFCQAIIKLSNDPILRQKMGKYGYNRIINTLNWGNSAAELRKAYCYLEV